MATMKNQHIVYYYAEYNHGGYLLVIGITPIGWDYLNEEQGNFLTASHPEIPFINVREVWVITGESKEDIKQQMDAALGPLNIKRPN